MSDAVITRGRAVVTDLGRTRGPNVGLPVGGAMDQFSARLANARVGNSPDAPVLELTGADTSFVPEHHLVIAATGARCEMRIDGALLAGSTAVVAPAGHEVSCTAISGGFRVYVAIAGGVAAPLMMGSCAPDPMLGMGTILGPGDRVDARTRWTGDDAILLRVLPEIAGSAPASLLRVLPGPDFADYGGTESRLFTETYTVHRDSNHVGLRFEGQAPHRLNHGELLSRAVPIGAVEIPSPDQVIVLHRGRGATAGYPVPAVVASADLDGLAQVVPGDPVTFRIADAAELRAQRQRLDAWLFEITTRSARALRPNLVPSAPGR